MSSPTRQMSSRKLPPLPGSRSPFGTKSNTAHSSTTNSASAPIYANDKRGHEKSNKDLSKSLNDGPFRPALVSTSCDKQATKDSPKQCKYFIDTLNTRLVYIYRADSRQGNRLFLQRNIGRFTEL